MLRAAEVLYPGIVPFIKVRVTDRNDNHTKVAYS